MSFISIIKICKVSNQLVPDSCVISRRFVRARNILGNLHRERVNIFALLDTVGISYYHMFLSIEILIAGKLSPVFRTTFEPLAKLITFNPDKKGIELKIILCVYKDSPLYH